MKTQDWVSKMVGDLVDGVNPVVILPGQATRLGKQAGKLASKR